jgi:hypothetical protein
MTVNVQIPDITDPIFGTVILASMAIDLPTFPVVEYNLLITEVTTVNEMIKTRTLLKVVDLLGRETKETTQPLFYIYDDGTVEKRIIIE